jgi:hypothetical protein
MKSDKNGCVVDPVKRNVCNRGAILLLHDSKRETSSYPERKVMHNSHVVSASSTGRFTEVFARAKKTGCLIVATMVR